MTKVSLVCKEKSKSAEQLARGAHATKALHEQILAQNFGVKVYFESYSRFDPGSIRATLMRRVIRHCRR